MDVSYPGPWGNPFLIGVHGTAEDCVRLYENLMAGFVSVDHDNWLSQRMSYFHVRHYILSLKGKDLACTCPLNQPCHADVLLRLANQVDR